MKRLFSQYIITVIALLFLTPLLPAGPVTIDFENLPALGTQPNNFAAAGAMQTYVLPGIAAISGGVVLGNPTFLGGFAAHGSSPNAYGTADFADPSLLSTLTFKFDPSEAVTEVSGVLFNGQTMAETYTVTVTALAGGGVFTFSNIPQSSSASDFANFDVLGTGITEVDITTPNFATNGWDFFVDTVVVNTSAAAVPEPPSVLVTLLIAATMLGCGSLVRRKVS